MEEFDRYVATQVPLPWTIVKEHPNSWLIGNHAMAISYRRFGLIVDAVKKYFKRDSVVLDVGVYPGLMPKLFYEFHPGKDKYQYYGCGIGFDKEFREKMEYYDVQLLECDLDPRLWLANGRLTSIPLEDENVDLCIFTDVIEHFYDSYYPLTEVNRVCKMGAILILTTDNITRFSSVVSLLKGQSCNTPLIETNLFYTGDWRPHFREYSKGELYQLLQWAGFQIISHRFYDPEFGYWRVLDEKLAKIRLGQAGIMGKVKKAVKRIVGKSIPHFRDNHIIVAMKCLDYVEMLKSAPIIVNSKDDWVAQRKRFNAD